MKRRFVIVGAGHAGGRAAAALRDEGFSGEIILLGAEAHAPYERPPLSKGVLTGARTAQSCLLFEPGALAARGVDLRLSRAVEEIDADARALRLAGGEAIAWDRLLLCTGGRPRRLPLEGASLPGVHMLRTLDDAAAIAAELAPGHGVASGRWLVVIGGGFIGLEVAASARARGAEVVVVEAADQLMGRVVAPQLAELVRELHAAHGVRVLTGVKPEAILGDGRVSGVVVDSGETLAADAVVIGVGIVPATELAAAAGLDVDNGIVTDESCQTSKPDIFAAGDVARFRHPLFGRHIRLESWRNAEVQPVVAARAMLGRDAVCDEVPWLWSDQYDQVVQVAGLCDRNDEITRREAPGATFYFHFRGDRLLGACGFGGAAVGRDIRVAQMLIARGGGVDRDRLADPSTKLKSLLRAA